MNFLTPFFIDFISSNLQVCPLSQFEEVFNVLTISFMSLLGRLKTCISLCGVLSPFLTIDIPGKDGSAIRRIFSFSWTQSVRPTPESFFHTKPSYAFLVGSLFTASEVPLSLINTIFLFFLSTTSVSILHLTILIVSENWIFCPLPILSPFNISLLSDTLH